MEQQLTTDSMQLILADQDRLAELRRPYEPYWRECDRYVDPFGAGAFDGSSVATVTSEIEERYDITAIDSLDRYTAAIAGITIPRGQFWHGLKFGDDELMKIANVKRWCENSRRILFLARYSPLAGFETQAHADIRQEGKYGTSGLWIGDMPGQHIYYKAIHCSELYIDEDYSGRVARVHRKWTTTLRKAVAEFGLENLSPKSQRVFEEPGKRDSTKIEILQVLRPNDQYEAGYLGAKGKKFELLTIEPHEKHLVKRSGFHSWPLPVSRHVTGPKDVWGRSPAMKAIATIRGADAMARTILDAGNRAGDPPLLVSDDADIVRVATRPGGLTFGGVNDQGNPMIIPLMSGAQLPITMELIEGERQVIKRVFLEELFRLLSDPSDRMTATQVLEQLKKEGVLVAPFAGRRETEKHAPQVLRELDILMRAGVIPPFPEEVREAGASPMVEMTNPLSRMARAEEATGFSRWTEMGLQAAAAGRPDALDRVNFDEGMKITADVLGVPASAVYSDDELEERRAAQSEKQGAAEEAALAPDMAKAALDAAKANEIAANLAAGGGLG